MVAIKYINGKQKIRRKSRGKTKNIEHKAYKQNKASLYAFLYLR